MRHHGNNYEMLLSVDDTDYEPEGIEIKEQQESLTAPVPEHREEWGSKVDESTLSALSREELENMVGESVVLKVTRQQEYKDEPTALEIVDGAVDFVIRKRDIVSYHRCRVLSADKFSIDFVSEYEDTFSCWTNNANSWFAVYSNEFETIEVFSE